MSYLSLLAVNNLNFFSAYASISGKSKTMVCELSNLEFLIDLPNYISSLECQFLPKLVATCVMNM